MAISSGLVCWAGTPGPAPKTFWKAAFPAPAPAETQDAAKRSHAEFEQPLMVFEAEVELLRGGGSEVDGERGKRAAGNGYDQERAAGCLCMSRAPDTSRSSANEGPSSG
jgi:hypothetical protein